MGNAYIKLTKDQLDKVGNTLIYLANKLDGLSKTKALKLIYILDELSIKKSGIPFFNLKYKVWKFGPVSEELFIDLSSETTLLKDYIKRTSEEGVTLIEPTKPFNNDEFTDNDLELLDYVIQEFGNKSAKDLVYYTHRKNAPWYNTAVKHDVLDLLEKEEINNTEFLIDMQALIQHDSRKLFLYQDYTQAT